YAASVETATTFTASGSRRACLRSKSTTRLSRPCWARARPVWAEARSALALASFCCTDSARATLAEPAAATARDKDSTKEVVLRKGAPSVGERPLSDRLTSERH